MLGPVLLLPVWIQFYRGRGVGRFLIAFICATSVGIGLTALALLLPSGPVCAASFTAAALADNEDGLSYGVSGRFSPAKDWTVPPVYDNSCGPRGTMNMASWR